MAAFTANRIVTALFLIGEFWTPNASLAPLAIKSSSTPKLNETLTLVCEVRIEDDDYKGPKLKWLHDDKPINQETNPWKYTLVLIDAELVLTIMAINEMDQGIYMCSAGDASVSYDLDLQLAPEILLPNHTHVAVGDPVTILCALKGRHTQIKWEFKSFGNGNMSATIYKQTFKAFGVNVSQEYNRNGTLLTIHLPTAQVHQSGTYNCYNNKQFSFSELEVVGSEIRCEPNETTAKVGNDVTYNCGIDINPPVDDWNIAWTMRKEGFSVNPIPVGFKYSSSLKNISLGTHLEVYAELNIKDITRADHGSVYIISLYIGSVMLSTFHVQLIVEENTLKPGGVLLPLHDNDIDNVTLIYVPTIVGSTLGALAFIIAIVMGCALYRRHKQRKARTEAELRNNSDLYEYHSEANILKENPTFTNYGYHIPPPKPTSRKENSYMEANEMPKDILEFPRKNLQLGVDIGEGRFGKIMQARAFNIKGCGIWEKVAVKTNRGIATTSEKEDLLQELTLMRKLSSHPNVVTLLGCCSQSDPLYIILEYVHRGSLLNYLRKCRPSSQMSQSSSTSAILPTSSFMTPRAKDLTIFALQIARGMAHVASHGIIHRDIATRNVLLATDFTCKICDFGLSRDIEGIDVYERKSKGPLPIRWMAPEALLDNMYTKKSDVWSYGILLWEIVTLGATPYQGVSAMDVMRIVLQGHVLQQPLHCKEEMYELMTLCWSKMDERPMFADIVEHIEALMDDDYIVLSNYKEHEYSFLEPYTMDERV